VDRRLIEWMCPTCKTVVLLDNEKARKLAEQAGGCQGCRAKVTFEKKPELMSLFVGFWTRTSFPQSASWTGSLEVVS